jgi:uroporphyrinogen decarboxylase
VQPIRRFGMDGAILFSDILVVAHGLGRSVTFRDGEGPVLEPLRRIDEVLALETLGLTDRLAPVYETVRQVRALLPATTALIGFAGGPWTVASYMVEGHGSRDFAATKTWAFAAPDDFDVLIGCVTDATIAHLAAQIEAGAEIVQLFDSWAGVLPEAEFRRFVIVPTRRIVAALALHHPGVPVIGFPRGAGLMYRSYVSETKIGAIGLDQTVPCDIARKMLQSLVPVQGNLDPLCLVAGGAALDAAVARIRAAFAGGPFVFNLGHGVLPQTPVDHVARLIALLRNAA